MRKRPLLVVIPLVSVILFTLAGLAFVGIRSALEQEKRRSTHDAVLVIAGDIASLYQKNPSAGPAEIDARVRILVEGSVINAGFVDGRPADCYGTPFRVTHVAEGRRHAVTVSSAGPDRLFGTADDLSHEVSWEAPPPDNR